MARVRALGARGRWFESSLPDTVSFKLKKGAGVVQWLVHLPSKEETRVRFPSPAQFVF